MTSRIGARTIGVIAGPAAFASIMLFYHPSGMSASAHAVLACTVWIAIWWISEALPIAVTSLLPIILFPLTGGSDIKAAVSGYSHPFVFLFIGGFLIAIAMEKWMLHKRIAMVIISWMGTSKRMIIMGFMLATAFLSMWISNTATALMMLPIGMAIIERFRENRLGDKDKFGTILMLSIAYSASIGGVATLLGSPPNLIFVSIIQETYGVSISFFDWFIIAFPISVLLLAATWVYLTRFSFPIDEKSTLNEKDSLKIHLQDLGKMGLEERRVAMIFGLTALAWVTRSFILQPLLPNIDDTIIALIAAVMLFIVPASERGEKLLSWKDASQLPWGYCYYLVVVFRWRLPLKVADWRSG